MFSPNRLFTRILALIFALIIASIAGSVWAQNEESEENRLAAEKAKRRHYAGGKDEPELTVQAVLAQPTRYPADPRAASGLAKEPAQEDMHD